MTVADGTGQTMNEAQHSSIRVECYSGYRADEEPRRFFIDDRAINVDTILDRWLEPAHRYFKVRGGDGGIYILRHDINADRWELRMNETRLSSST
jgi:hypothetical protein